jgi:chromosome segregation ATPase
MSEIIKNKYLDYAGLKKYDELLKALIESGHKGLADAIAALDAKLGSLEFEGSDDKSFAEVINEIYAAIAGLDAKDAELDAKDAELEGKIKDIIGDLESLEGLTLADINAKLSEHAATIAQHTTEIADVTERVSALEETVKNLGEIEGGESLGDIVNKVNANAVAIETLKGEGEGSVKKAAADAQAAAEATAAADATSKADAALAAAKEYADGLAGNYDAAGSAAAALAAAKEYADSLDTVMDARVDALEAIDHEQLVADAVAAVVAGAESDFDTLKEVAEWIAADTLGSAALQTTVSEHTTSINTINGDIDALEAKVDGDIANLTTHMSEAATALAEVDGRLDALEAFEETHASIEISDIEGLFA